MDGSGLWPHKEPLPWLAHRGLGTFAPLGRAKSSQKLSERSLSKTWLFLIPSLREKEGDVIALMLSVTEIISGSLGASSCEG